MRFLKEFHDLGWGIILKRFRSYIQACIPIFDNDNDDDNEFILAYPFYMKLALRPKIIYTKKNTVQWDTLK